MRWFVGLHPKYFSNQDQLVRDFIDSEADILYTHIDFRPVGSIETKAKNLVIFIENPYNNRKVAESIFAFLREIKENWNRVIVTGPTTKEMKELATSVYSEQNWFPLWLVLPYTYLLYQQKTPPTYGDYLMAWVAAEAKGKGK
jgi:hypothetical protein